MVCQEGDFSQSRSMLRRRGLLEHAARPLVQVDTVVPAPSFLLEVAVELLRSDYMAELAAER